MSEQTTIQELLKALKLANRYIGKAVADDLMTNCSISPTKAFRHINSVIAKVEKELKTNQ